MKRVIVAISVAGLVGLGFILGTPGADGTTPPEPPFRTDRDHSDAYALRLEALLEEGNPPAVAEEIARSQLNGIKAACNIEKLESSEQLHDIPFVISLDIDRREPTRNKVMGYTSVAKAPRQTVAVTSGKKPWERK